MDFFHFSNGWSHHETSRGRRTDSPNVEKYNARYLHKKETQPNSGTKENEINKNQIKRTLPLPGKLNGVVQ